jgi:hypothetical protein
MQKLITGSWDENIIVKKPGSPVKEEEFNFEGDVQIIKLAVKAF